MEKMIKELTAMAEFFDCLKILAIQLESIENVLDNKIQSINQKNKKCHNNKRKHRK